MKQVIILLLCTLFVEGYCSVWYVSQEGNDSNAGRTWDTALSNVQTAIDLASSGDEVWIAGGTYRASALRVIDGEELFATSFILKNGVSLFGGFRGVEDSKEDRPGKNGSWNVWDFMSETVLTTSPKMPGTVLYGGTDVFSDSVVIDGLTLRGGCALGSGWDGRGGGALLPGNAVMQNCIVEGNIARKGGGLALIGNAVVRRSQISGNTLVPGGGGGEGGGIYCFDDGGCISNCLVYGNGVDGNVASGGGIYAESGTRVEFSSIVMNGASRKGAGIFFAAKGTLLNSVVWGNSGTASQLSSGYGSIKASAVEGYCPPGDNIILQAGNSGPNGTDVNDNAIDEYYACFRNPYKGDFRLSAGSYLINRGCEISNTGFEVDASGLSRVQSGICDIGAYESFTPGNLAVDFHIDYPCIYGGKTNVVPVFGISTPENLHVEFCSEKYKAEWKYEGGQWCVEWPEAGIADSRMECTVKGDTENCWNKGILTRNFPVGKRPLCITVDDKELMYGEEMPEFTWSITAGTLALGDTITGLPHCTFSGDYQSEYSITQGTLSVNDGDFGKNYNLHVIPGMLLCSRAVCRITLESSGLDYTSHSAVLQIKTEPSGLKFSCVYTGTGNTVYGPTTVPPVEVGTYSVQITVDDEYYCGFEKISFEIQTPELCCLPDKKEK